MPSYTPRRVSAERDFPPGCGPGAVLTTQNLPTPQSRPSSPQHDHRSTFGTYYCYLIAPRHPSNGGGKAIELTTAPHPATPYATTTVDDDEEEELEEEDYWMESPEIDFVDDEEEELAAASPGFGEHMDYDDMYYDEEVAMDLIDEFLRTMSSEEAAANGGEGEVCVVCQDDLCREDRTIGILDCGHRFHADCVGKWLLLKNVCPLCKAFGLGCFA